MHKPKSGEAGPPAGCGAHDHAACGSPRALRECSDSLHPIAREHRPHARDEERRGSATSGTLATRPFQFRHSGRKRPSIPLFALLRRLRTSRNSRAGAKTRPLHSGPFPTGETAPARPPANPCFFPRRRERRLFTSPKRSGQFAHAPAALLRPAAMADSRCEQSSDGTEGKCQ